MEWLNPVEWVAWLYGKCFQQHPFVGGSFVVAFFATFGLILWIRGVDKFKEEHRGERHQVATDAAASSASESHTKSHQIDINEIHPTSAVDKSFRSKGNSPVPAAIAPHGIAITGGNVTNPTVNNYGAPQRLLTEEEREKFISYLRPFCPFDVIVRPIPGNAESMEYADQIAKAIKEAGCILGRTPLLIDNGVSYGIDIAIHDTNDVPSGADALAGAFLAAGIRFKSVAGDPVKPKAVYIMVNLNDSN